MTDSEIQVLAAAMGFTTKAIEGVGFLKGAPCTIQSIEEITGGNRVTFAWETSAGESETSTLDVMNGVDGQAGAPGANGKDGTDGKDGADGTDGVDGVGISSITYKETDQSGNYVYTVTLTNTNTYDIVCPKGPQGATGQTGQDGAPGIGVPSGGTTGQVLKKKSDTNFDTEWSDESGGGGGDTYTKSEVMNMFVKSNDLTAYILTFAGQNGKTITLTETGQQDPVSYTFDIPASGTHTDIFFFNKGEELSVKVNGVATQLTLQLVNYIATFSLEVPIGLIPKMTDYTVPSGTAGASGNAPYPAWRAFDQIADHFWAHDGGMPNAYLQYDWSTGQKVIPSYIILHPLSSGAEADIVVQALLWDDQNNAWVNGSEETTLRTSSAVKWNGENSCNGRIDITNTFATNKVRIKYISTTYSSNANSGGVQVYGSAA